MRLVQVAKALGMTGQQLRKELTLVDFGVKPTDREISENMAQGVIRYLARKYNIPIDIEAALKMTDDGGEEESQTPPVSQEEAPQSAPAAPAPVSAPEAKEGLHVLRKLNLEGVSKEAIARHTQKVKVLTKEEKEEKLREEKLHPHPKRGATTSVHQQQIKKKEGTVLLPDQISVKEFAEKTGVQVPQVIQVLMKNGVLATITQSIDYDTAAVVAAELGVTVAKEQTSANVEHLLSKNLEELLKDEPENLVPRPPIVVVMGHVDHGKTSILDAIRQTDVVSGEAGGITQHIGAYQVSHDGKQITFLDTPGHQAFTAMRARGANLTDIAVLVVSAEEGPKETTLEALHHAQEAGVPIIVAINKIDRPNADIEKVKGEMASHGLQPEEWGGKTPFVLTSAVTKQGITDLLDHILLIAELENLRANPNRSAVATVIESHLDPSLGSLATVIVNAGTLHVGDAFLCGRTVGKVRALSDAAGKRLTDVPPSGAVRVSGFDDVPQVGDVLQVVASEREARDVQKQLLDQSGAVPRRTFADLVTRLSEGKSVQLKLVVKADTQGSLEAIQGALEKQGTAEAQVKVIHGAIGAISESDIMMASASGALVAAFRVPVNSAVQNTAEREGVKIREYDVIYKLFEDVDGLLQGLLIPDELEKVLGHLEVKGVFFVKKSEQTVGGVVRDGIVKRVQFRLQRGDETLGTGRITSLRKVDNDIKEAKEGTECGLKIESNVPVEIGDVLEVFSREFKKKE
ncbi:translation initiation factor IF-2 [Candidatus Peregrinibacteria bacterium]|nr:translation initiation factor IF-2 [Candidatus Peregrinibacteria bacterium]